MNKQYWIEFYKGKSVGVESSFARFVLPLLPKKAKLIDIGCGDARDTFYFLNNGIIAAGTDQVSTGESITQFMKENKSPQFVYARFFWHAIEREDQIKILKWVKSTLFIEARTTEDKNIKKVHGGHKRNYVNVPQLVKDLKNHGFQIEYMSEGRGVAKFKTEDPHVIRIIAKKI